MVFNQIRVVNFACVMVMQIVVLMRPGGRILPIEPIEQTPPTPGKLARVIALGQIWHAVVTAVQHVMRNLAPARDIAQAEQKNGDRVDREGRQ